MTLSSKKLTLPGLRLKSISGLHPSIYGLILVSVLFILVAVYHLLQQPYPNNWDDAWYTIHTFRWLKFIENRGDFLRGAFWGYIYALPSQYPTMVFITSLAGGLLGGTIFAMRLAHLVWFMVMLGVVYRIGKELAGGWIGLLCVAIVGTMDLVFFWGKAIMGEPSLFAAVALLLLLLILWGDKLTLWRGAIIGLVIGFGFLTKQHFPALAIGPLGIWGLWLAFKCFRDRTQLKSTLLALLAAFTTTISVASLWYLVKLSGIIAYYGDPNSLHRRDFLPSSLGPVVSWETIKGSVVILVGQLGWPAILLVSAGVLWACYQIIRLKTENLDEGNKWKALTLLLLLSSGAIGVIAVIMTRTWNTRFYAPVLIPWGILAGLAIGSWWNQKHLAVRVGILIVLLFQGVFWWSQSFDSFFPHILPFLPERSYMRPIDIEPLPEVLNVVEKYTPPAAETKIWTVGNNFRFNSPMLYALIMERGYNWESEPLYEWFDNDLTLILERLSQREWVVVYESVADRPDLFTSYDGDTMGIRHDHDILQWLNSHPSTFELISKLESATANNRIWVFKILQGKDQ